MMQAYNHKGFSIIEVLQNCVIFTDGIHEKITGRDTKDEHQVVLEQGEPIMFGKEKEFGLKVEGMKLNKMTLEDEIGGSLIHDPTEADTAFHLALAVCSCLTFL
jgi:2-oxoglutarate ferredoxin oxidoreductase subunit beta